MSFSSTVRLDSSSDYINPSNVCVIALSPENQTQQTEKTPAESDQVRVHDKTTRGNSDKAKSPNDVSLPQTSRKAPSPPSKVQISLADCLACSGCVTSAEEVLIERHGTANLLKTIDAIFQESVGVNNAESQKALVASISPQTIADLCVHYGDSSPLVTFQNVFRFLTESIGFHYVFTTEFAERISSYAVAAEYLDRVITQDTPETTLGNTSSQLPLLTSACPGFVCYIEKQHPSLVPHLSRVMSQQSITGVIVNSIFHEPGKAPAPSNTNYFHLSIQPCFDRKLEASRELNEIYTHSVISTLELVLWMEERGFEGVKFVKNEESIGRALSHEQLTLSSQSNENIAEIRGLRRTPAWLRLHFDLPHPLTKALASDNPLWPVGVFSSLKNQTAVSAAIASIRPNACEIRSQSISGNEQPVDPRGHDVSHEVSPRTTENNHHPMMEGSGGYHKDILLCQWMRKTIPSVIQTAPCPPQPQLLYRTRRNSNHQEAFLLDTNDSTPTQDQVANRKASGPFVTIMYGFQHIQNLTRCLKREHLRPNGRLASFIENYSDFIEVMACPGGCINGSAQSRKKENVGDSQEYVRRVEQRFNEWKAICEPTSARAHDIGETNMPRTLSLSVNTLLDNLCGDCTEISPAMRLFSAFTPFLINWQRHSKESPLEKAAPRVLTQSDIQW